MEHIYILGRVKCSEWTSIICNRLKFENGAHKPEKVVGMKMMRGSNDFCREMQHRSCTSLTNPLKAALIQNVSQVTSSCHAAHGISTMILYILSVSRQHRCMWLYLKIVRFAAERTNISSLKQELKVWRAVLFPVSGDWEAKNTFFRLSALLCVLERIFTRHLKPSLHQ